VLLDATREGAETPELRLGFATVRAQSALGGPVALSGASAAWSSTASPPGGFGTLRPVSVRYSFVRADLPEDRRIATVGAGGAGGPVAVGNATVRAMPIPGPVDIEGVLKAVELQGGAAIREEWARQGPANWFANAFTEVRDGRLAIVLTYSRPQGSGAATFRYDVASGRVERTQ
jgi:hypothetical protein